MSEILYKCIRKNCNNKNCHHLKPHKHKTSCDGDFGPNTCKCVPIQQPDIISGTSFFNKGKNMINKDKNKLLKSLNLFQKVWYYGVPSIIDCLISGEIVQGNKGKVRIYPEDRLIHLDKNGKRILAGDGTWINENNKEFSITPPPVKISWKNSSASKFGNLDLGKASRIGSLLISGKILTVDRGAKASFRVMLDSTNNLEAVYIKSGVKMHIDKLQKLITENNDDEWYTT